MPRGRRRAAAPTQAPKAEEVKVGGTVETPADVVSTAAGNGALAEEPTVGEVAAAEPKVEEVKPVEKIGTDTREALAAEAIREAAEEKARRRDAEFERDALQEVVKALRADLEAVTEMAAFGSSVKADEEVLSDRLQATINKLRNFARTGNANKLKEAKRFLDAEISALRI